MPSVAELKEELKVLKRTHKEIRITGLSKAELQETLNKYKKPEAPAPAPKPFKPPRPKKKIKPLEYTSSVKAQPIDYVALHAKNAAYRENMRLKENEEHFKKYSDVPEHIMNIYKKFYIERQTMGTYLFPDSLFVMFVDLMVERDRSLSQVHGIRSYDDILKRLDEMYLKRYGHTYTGKEKEVVPEPVPEPVPEVVPEVKEDLPKEIKDVSKIINKFGTDYILKHIRDKRSKKATPKLVVDESEKPFDLQMVKKILNPLEEKKLFMPLKIKNEVIEKSISEFKNKQEINKQVASFTFSPEYLRLLEQKKFSFIPLKTRVK